MAAKKDNNSKKGSVLVYTLVVMFLILIAAIGIASVVVVEMKNTAATDSSTSAFQAADSGVEIIQRMRAYLNNLSTPLPLTMGNINSHTDPNPGSLGYYFRTCASGVYGFSLENGADVKLSFTNDLGDAIVSCSPTDNRRIAKVKATGIYENTARSVEYTFPPSCLEFGTISQWTLEKDSITPEGSGFKAEDAVNTNDAILGDGTCDPDNAAGTNCPIYSSDGMALEFDGNNNTDVGDYIRAPHDASLDVTTDFSISMWLKRGRNWTGEDLYSKNGPDPNTDGALTLATDGNNKLSAIVQMQAVVLRSNTSVIAGRWHHVVLTRGSDNVWRIYLDSIIDGEATSSVFPSPAFDEGLGIGGEYNGIRPNWPFKGFINKVRLFDCRLTNEEVGKLYSEDDKHSECSDGIDNESTPDGQIDFPADSDCSSESDPSESP